MITFFKRIYGNTFFRSLGCINKYYFTPPQKWMLWIAVFAKRQLHLCGYYCKKDKCLQWHLLFRGVCGSDSAHCHNAMPPQSKAQSSAWAAGAVLSSDATVPLGRVLTDTYRVHVQSALVLSSVLALTETQISILCNSSKCFRHETRACAVLHWKLKKSDSLDLAALSLPIMDKDWRQCGTILWPWSKSHVGKTWLQWALLQALNLKVHEALILTCAALLSLMIINHCNYITPCCDSPRDKKLFSKMFRVPGIQVHGYFEGCWHGLRKKLLKSKTF